MMPSYHSKNELAFYNTQVEGYNHALEVWKELCFQLNEAHEKSMIEWQGQHDSDELTAETEEAPTPPLLPQEPEAVDPSSLKVYEARMAETVEEIETPNGQLLILPGRMVLTDNDGVIFSISEQEFNSGYIVKSDD
jgi:hypothetical protein